MSEATTRAGANPFKLRAVLGLVIFGAIAFVAMLYLIGAGDTGRRDNDGAAHAAANGLNGFSGLAELLELEGFEVRTSRSPTGLQTSDLLILTPPMGTDPQEFGEILLARQYTGPTLVILPKWFTGAFPPIMPDEVSDEVKDGWVQLRGAQHAEWASELPQPYAISFVAEEEDQTLRPPDRTRQVSWQGMGFSGGLPDRPTRPVIAQSGQAALVENETGQAIAIDVHGEEESEFYTDAFASVFVIEPDLLNNYGLSDRQRAALAVELVNNANYYDDEEKRVVFDLTLNGFGGSQNLLTLAFTPPFLAATLCLILALMVIGWRAFLRFGPPHAEGPAIAFGKRQLVTNGAGLILRARRLPMLAAPYIALSARRMASRLGLTRAETAQIDGLLAARFPDDPGFVARANALRNARGTKEILRAAQALKELERKISQ
jgi:hypothetical protein